MQEAFFLGGGRVKQIPEWPGDACIPSPFFGIINTGTYPRINVDLGRFSCLGRSSCHATVTSVHRGATISKSGVSDEVLLSSNYPVFPSNWKGDFFSGYSSMRA